MCTLGYIGFIPKIGDASVAGKRIKMMSGDIWCL